MDIAHLIKHPEELDRETLYDLRGLLALYPYYQSARLLLLQNLYLLHDISFNEELRNAALYITDRKVIFNLVESAHYQLPKPRNQRKSNSRKDRKKTVPSLSSTASCSRYQRMRKLKKKNRRKRNGNPHLPMRPSTTCRTSWRRRARKRRKKTFMPHR